MIANRAVGITPSTFRRSPVRGRALCALGTYWVSRHGCSRRSPRECQEPGSRLPRHRPRGSSLRAARGKPGPARMAGAGGLGDVIACAQRSRALPRRRIVGTSTYSQKIADKLVEGKTPRALRALALEGRVRRGLDAPRCPDGEGRRGLDGCNGNSARGGRNGQGLATGRTNGVECAGLENDEVGCAWSDLQGLPHRAPKAVLRLVAPRAALVYVPKYVTSSATGSEYLLQRLAAPAARRTRPAPAGRRRRIASGQTEIGMATGGLDSRSAAPTPEVDEPDYAAPSTRSLNARRCWSLRDSRITDERSG